MQKTVQEVINTDYREYSMYVLQHRAIPSCIDGLKPVQRKLLYAMLSKGGKKIKIAELGGSLSSFGFHHGEASAMSAAVNMAAAWDNNAPLFEGHGNFGSRIIQEAAAPRYIFASVSSNFNKYFTHNEVCPQSNDDDTPEPLYYLPAIPWALVNGSKGIAVGFATNILPRSPERLAMACREYVEGKKISPRHFVPSFPDFNGTVEHVAGNQYRVCGKAEIEKGLQVRITELPVGYDREYYIGVLNKMIDSDKITDYEDCCSENGFEFVVKINRVQKAKIEKDVLGYFKLETTMTENITTLDENGNLKLFDNAQDLLTYFCNFRIRKCGEYINYMLDKLSDQIKFNTQKRDFIKLVLSGKINLLKLTKQEVIDEAVANNIAQENAEKFVSLPIYTMTTDNIATLEQQIKNLIANKVVWEATNEEQLFLATLKQSTDKNAK